MKENKFQQSLIGLIKREGGTVINFAPSAFMTPGIPDIYVHHRMYQGFFELKVNKNIYSPAQAAYIKKLNHYVPNSAWGLRLDGQILQLERVEQKGKGIVISKYDWRLVKAPIATLINRIKSYDSNRSL